MGYTNNAKNGKLEQFRSRITHVSLHSADPGTTGNNEVTGGGYSRATAPSSDWGAASGGIIELLVDKPFSGPADGTITHFGAWDDTTFLGHGTVSGGSAFNAEGNAILKAGTTANLNA